MAIPPDCCEDTPFRRRYIGLKMNVVSRLMRRNFDKIAARIGVTRSQWQMIVEVGRNSGVTQRAIADALEVSEAAAGRLIDRLCADGLLERRERDDDRRARAVYLTPKSEQMLDVLGDLAVECENALFKDFTEAELEQFENFLDRLHHTALRANG